MGNWLLRRIRMVEGESRDPITSVGPWPSQPRCGKVAQDSIKCNSVGWLKQYSDTEFGFKHHALDEIHEVGMDPRRISVA